MIETIERYLATLPDDAPPEKVKAGIEQACLEFGGVPEEHRVRVDEIRKGLDYWMDEKAKKNKDEGEGAA